MYQEPKVRVRQETTFSSLEGFRDHSNEDGHGLHHHNPVILHKRTINSDPPRCERPGKVAIGR